MYRINTQKLLQLYPLQHFVLIPTFRPKQRSRKMTPNSLKMFLYRRHDQSMREAMSSCSIPFYRIMQPLSQSHPQVFLDIILQPIIFKYSCKLSPSFFLLDHRCYLNFLYSSVLSKQIVIRMVPERWKVFTITFITYALVHSARTSWSSLKYALNSPPYAFEPLYLGTLDMVVLIVLAISLNIFGPMIEKLGAKEFLMKGLIFLSVLLTLLGFLLLLEIGNGWPYSIIYPLIGVGSCVGWPACIFILSKHFEKGLAFSLWTGSSQFGDFVALVMSYLLVEQGDLNPGLFLMVMAALLGAVYYLNKFYLVEGNKQEDNVPVQSPVEVQANALIEEAEAPHSNSQINTPRKQKNHKEGEAQQQKSINFITVWKLPSVPGYIMSFLFVKSVNAVVVTWLIFYLSMIGMVKQSRIIAVLWAVSTFCGGIIGSYFNPTFNKTIFIASLIASAILFIFLEEVHLYPSQTEVTVLIVTCGLIFGGPFTLMSSSIPLLLSQKPQIKNIPGAKAAIVSAMQGYGLLFCGASLLIVPVVGVIDLHWVASIYCTISACILLFQHLKQLKQEMKKNTEKKHSTQHEIKLVKREDKFNKSAPIIHNQQKKRRSNRDKSKLSKQKQKQQSQNRDSQQKQKSMSQNKSEDKQYKRKDIQQPRIQQKMSSIQNQYQKQAQMNLPHPQPSQQSQSQPQF